MLAYIKIFCNADCQRLSEDFEKVRASSLFSISAQFRNKYTRNIEKIYAKTKKQLLQLLINYFATLKRSVGATLSDYRLLACDFRL